MTNVAKLMCLISLQDNVNYSGVYSKCGATVVFSDNDEATQVNNVEIPLQDDIKENHQQASPINHLSSQGINPPDVPFLMNIDPPQLIMKESPILPFQLQLPEEVCNL